MSLPDWDDEATTAGVIGVSQRTLRRLRQRNEGPPYYQPSPGIRLSDRDEVLAWLRAQRVKPVAPTEACA